VALFRDRFAFMGTEVVKEFLMSIAILPGAHRDDCPVQGRILLCRPAWAETAMARSDA
jgi:DNA-3-methyladenine glycosylase I